MLQVQLKVIGGKHDGRLIPISTAKFLIGREQDCHLRPNSDLVSRHHCVLSIDAFSVRLRDLGSTNGTFVNGERLRGQVELKEDDVVLVGKLKFSMKVSQPAEVAPAPAVDVEPVAPAGPSSEDTVNGVKAADEDTVQIGETDPNVAPTLPADLAGQPSVDGNDTTMFNMPAMPPQMPGAPQPGQYPGAPPYGQPPYGQPQQGYPMYGYPQQPYPYQPGMPYPQQGMPYPQQPAPGMVETPQDPADTLSSDGLALRLPDPSETGLKAPAPTSSEEKPEQDTEEKPSNSAADIIKQYMNRRPGS